jgi:hypothetical protein
MDKYGYDICISIFERLSAATLSFSPRNKIPVILNCTQEIHLFDRPCFAGAFGENSSRFPVINRPFFSAARFINPFHRIRHIVLYTLFV